MPTDKRVRKLTVCNRGRTSECRPPVPDIRMSGNWLARAGFTAGCLLAVNVEQGRLVVTVIARQKNHGRGVTSARPRLPAPGSTASSRRIPSSPRCSTSSR